MTDPGGFGEMERSKGQLDAHAPLLARQASRMLAANPAADLVGVVVEQESPEYKRRRTLIEQGTGVELAGPVVSGIIGRGIAVMLLRSFAPDGVEWLEQNAPVRGKSLPLLFCARTGFRLGAVPVPGQSIW